MVKDVIIVCKKHGEFKQQPYVHSIGGGCPKCSDYGFNVEKKSIFYVRKIFLGKKVGIKYGITNQLDGNRKKQQIRGMKKVDDFKTIYKSKTFNNGEKVLKVENIIKKKFGKKGYFNKNEMKDGWTETIPYSRQNLDYVNCLVNKFLK